ncbi:MAG: phage tail sheath C-terminal domain-containing protein [Acidobacteriota bacterium]
MSESIAEMVLPGTYIEVRSEGLIAAGAIATGNIGIVGTAARGAVGEVVRVGSYAEAIDAFGAYDAFSATNPLTLVRALEQVFAGGGRDITAIRIANEPDGGLPSSSLGLRADGDLDAFALTANSPGSWGNKIEVLLRTDPADATRFQLQLRYRQIKETYYGTTVGALHGQVAAESRLVTVSEVSNGALAPVLVDPPQTLSGGLDGADVSAADVAAGLAVLEDQAINIVVVSGMGSNVVRGVVGAHLENTENDGNERIAVLGASASTAATVETEADSLADDRIVLVAPGIRAVDAASDQTISLPPAYTAAVVAGRLATVAPHVSLTNKTLPLTDLDTHYNTPTVKNLLQKRVLVVRRKFGYQVVKGISTDTGAFKQISVRRIVDYAKAGVRSSSDPYIGRLNNARVRAALKATLDGFLSQMVLDEMLVGYQLEVAATRAQEIRGIAAVTLTLLPTFSIDYIRVTMNLQ